MDVDSLYCLVGGWDDDLAAAALAGWADVGRAQDYVL